MQTRGNVDRRFRHGIAVLLVGTVSTATWLIAAGPALAQGQPASARSNAGAYDFNAPTSAAVVGSDLFVTNGVGNSVTEISAVSGAYVATINARRFGFAGPTAIQAVGSDLFVTNGVGNSVTEFSATHLRHIRTIRRAKFELADPIALASSGQDLFVLNRTGSITVVSARTGALVGVVSGATYGFDDPSDLVVAGANVFVANPAADTVTVINAQSRTRVAILAGSPYAFDTPTGVAFDGSNVWVTNQNSESVTEISATTLQELNWVQSGNLPMVGPITFGDGYVFTVSPPGSSPMVSQVVPSSATVTWMMCNTNGPYLFDNPEAVVVAGSNLWVVNEGGNSLTEMDTDSGALIRTVSN